MNTSLAKALERRGYTSLTPVQEAVTNPELGDADLLVSAQTGSGKTVGFGLAVAPTLLGEDTRFASASLPLALIIAPTRELALQVKRELGWLYAEAGAVVASCVGGMDMRDERRSLERGAHIVVATPGRLRDHIRRGSIDLSDVRAVVLDEADEMLDLGFREDLEFILDEAPEERRTLLFSATVPASIAQLAKSYQKDAVRVTTLAEKSQHADIEYQAMPVGPRDGENAIINVLRFYEAPNAIVFCNTRAMVGRIVTRLSNRGFSVVALSGELSQSERSHALQAMRDGRARVCVATDVAARGIDLPNLDLVIHAELPNSHETLLHRSGRTGRAGRKGVSALIVPVKFRKKAERLLKFAKLSATWGAAPSADAIKAKDEERMLADPAWEEDVRESETAAVAGLLERFSPEKLAAAYLRLYHSNRSAPEELSAVDDAPKKRAPFGPSVWFSIDIGRDEGADPRRLLPMLCRAGDISRDDIGAIRIQGQESYAEIRESSVAGFVAALGDAMALDDGTALKQLDTPPALKHMPRGKPGGAGARHRGGDRGFGGDRDRGEDRGFGKPGSKPRGPRREDGERPFRKPAPHRKGKPDSDAAPERTYGGDERGGVKAVKPMGKSAGKPAAKPTGKPSGKPVAGKFGGDRSEAPRAKGPKPPVGKPNSKKNKARAAARAAEKAASKGRKPGRGGEAAPRRPRA